MIKKNSLLPNNVLPDLLVFGISGSCTDAIPPDLAVVRSELEARGAEIKRQTDPAAVRALLPLRDDNEKDVGYRASRTSL